MTAPTDELAHALRGAADDVVERAHPRPVDATAVWRRGRRAAWAACAAAAGLAASYVLQFAIMLAGGGHLFFGRDRGRHL